MYNRTQWENDVTPLNEENMNNIESGIIELNEEDVNINKRIDDTNEYVRQINEIKVDDSHVMSRINTHDNSPSAHPYLLGLIDDRYTKTETNNKISAAIAELIGRAPEELNTLEELVNWINEHKTEATELFTALTASLNEHAGDRNLHVTRGLQDKWDAHVVDEVIHITEEEHEAYNAHIANNDVHVTTTNKRNWDSKAEGIHSHTANEVYINNNSGRIALSDYVVSLNEIIANINSDISGVNDTKLDKVTSAANNIRVYAVTTEGNQIMQKTSKLSAEANSVAVRTDDGTIFTESPTENLHAANKKYVDDTNTALDNKKLDKIISTGVNKLYSVNTEGEQSSIEFSQSTTAETIAQRNAGGALAVGTPTTDDEATPKSYVDTLGEQKLDKYNPATPGEYIYVSKKETENDDTVQSVYPISANTIQSFTVPLRNSNGAITTAAPTNDNEAANKAYTDAADATKLDKITSTGNNRAYTVTSEGAQSTETINQNASADSIAQRHSGGALTVGEPVVDSDATTKKYVDAAVAGLVNQSPETLDTLSELAEALGNDPNFATTITELIGTKADKNHDHDDIYSSIDHAHDSLYSKLGHVHDERYSSITHHHDDVYSLLTHNHDEDYSDIAHIHDDRYALLNHTHEGLTVEGVGGGDLTLVNFNYSNSISDPTHPEYWENNIQLYKNQNFVIIDDSTIGEGFDRKKYNGQQIDEQLIVNAILLSELEFEEKYYEQIEHNEPWTDADGVEHENIWYERGKLLLDKLTDRNILVKALANNELAVCKFIKVEDDREDIVCLLYVQEQLIMNNDAPVMEQRNINFIYLQKDIEAKGQQTYSINDTNGFMNVNIQTPNDWSYLWGATIISQNLWIGTIENINPPTNNWENQNGNWQQVQVDGSFVVNWMAKLLSTDTNAEEPEEEYIVDYGSANRETIQKIVNAPSLYTLIYNNRHFTFLNKKANGNKELLNFIAVDTENESGNPARITGLQRLGICTDGSFGGFQSQVELTVPRLATARTITASLSSNSGANFNGTSNITVGTIGILPASKGGTGKTSWSQDRLVYASGSTALSQLAFPTTAGSFLRQGASGAPYWTTPADVRTAIDAAPTSHSHDYLPLAGGTMTGELKAHNGISLDVGTKDYNSAMPFYLGIQAYEDGGKVFYRPAASVKADLGINDKADKNHTHSEYAAASHTHSQYLTSHQSLSNYLDKASAQTISGIKTFTEKQIFNKGLNVGGTSSNSRGYINWGDNNYVYIAEPWDDRMVINASGIYFKTGNTLPATTKPTSFTSKSLCPAVGGYLSGTTLYLFTMDG